MEKTSATVRSQQMYALIEKYLSSDLTQKQFCQQETMTMSTFLYWLRNYRRNQQNDNQSSHEFIPVRFAPRKNLSISAQPTCAVEYPNGVVVRLFGPVDVRIISRLVSMQAD